jgi:hypothetical protein
LGGASHDSLELNEDGSFAYIPDAEFDETDSFMYRAYDGRDYSEPATVTMTVTQINDAPVAIDDNYAVDQNSPLTVATPGVLANDTDVATPGSTTTVDGLFAGLRCPDADSGINHDPHNSERD